MRNLSSAYKQTLLLAALAISVTACGKPDSGVAGGPQIDASGEVPYNWDKVGNQPYPDYMGGNNMPADAVNNFAELINKYSQGAPKRTPWASTWWPYKDNGIANGSHGRNQSPAGKYDAARGHATKSQAWETVHHGPHVPGIQPGWWGHCNGWCAAAALFPEPTDTAKVNGVTFSIADIKGLITEAGMGASADFYGTRIDDPNTDPDAQAKLDDTVPDQYLLVLTNYMGKAQQDVLIDRYTGYQIWNQPLAGYTIQPPTPDDYKGEDPRVPGVFRIDVTSTVWWADDGWDPNLTTPKFDWTDSYPFASRTLRAEIWLDGPVVFDTNGKVSKSGNIIVTRVGDYRNGGSPRYAGGQWLGNANLDQDGHPDYMWVPFSIQPPMNKDQEDYENPEVDIDWLTTYLVNPDYPRGRDDPSTHGGSVDPAPAPSPSASPSPDPGHHHGGGASAICQQFPWLPTCHP